MVLEKWSFEEKEFPEFNKLHHQVQNSVYGIQYAVFRKWTLGLCLVLVPQSAEA